VHLSVEKETAFPHIPPPPIDQGKWKLARMLATFYCIRLACVHELAERAGHACMHMPNIRGHYYLWPTRRKVFHSLCSISFFFENGEIPHLNFPLNSNAHAHVPFRIDFHAPSPLSIIKNSFGLLSWPTGPLRYATKMHIIKIHPQEVGNKARE